MNWKDKPWSIEQRGIEQVPVVERHGNTRELFYIWFAANIGILGLLYGAIILTYHLTFWQGVIAAVIGSTSFLLVGYLGTEGKNTGSPMLIIARRSFGIRGNVLPSLVSWVNLLGWETIIWVTATEAILSLLQTVWKVQLRTFGTTIVFICLGGFTFLVALYGHATIVKVQKWISLIFGVSTLAVVIELFVHHQVHIPQVGTPGSFTHSFLPAVGFIVLVTGLSWATTASDYTRYLPSTTSSLRITLTVFLGAIIPLVGIIVAGMLLTPALPGLATSPNPLGELGTGLPVFWEILFWITAAVGLLTENILAIYSSGLILQTMHIRIARPWTAIVEFLLTGAAGWYFLISNSPFIGTFQTFLSLIGSTLAPWAGIMVMDFLLSKKKDFKHRTAGLYDMETTSLRSVRGHLRGFGILGLLSWLLGIAVTLLFASSPIWNGLFANTLIGTTQLGFLVGFLVSLLAYGLLHLFVRLPIKPSKQSNMIRQ